MRSEVGDHKTEVVKDLNVNGTWTFLCSCGRMGGDSTEEEARREAREHEEKPEQPELEEWTPEKHPIL